MGVLLSVAGVLFSAIIGMVVMVLFQDQVARMAARVPGSLLPVGRTRGISGKWFTYWGVIPDPATPSAEWGSLGGIDVIRLRRVGNRVFGRDLAKGAAYTISADFDSEAFLTGTWRDFRDDQNQWGSFQLYWGDGRQTMVGKFVGKDTRNHINHGMFLWARQPEALPGLAAWAKQVAGYEFDLQQVARDIQDGLARHPALHGSQRSP